MIFFNSSIPRSGSTLLQNILAQNPQIHATPTDGFLELIYGARVNYTSQAEFKAQDQDQMLRAWRGFCREGMKGYVAGLSNREHTCIKSRGIGEQYEWFSAFMGEDLKILVMVRDVRSVLASMERQYRKNTDKAQQVINPGKMQGLTTRDRVQSWLQGPPVGLALRRLQDMTLRGVAANCLILRFEDMTAYPMQTMTKVYEYLGLPAFEHDFANVAQVTQEDDVVYGLCRDLHAIRRVIEPIPPYYADILGDDLSRWISGQCAGYQKAYGYE
jgi:sulfotransferase